nr:helix-turn-helix transcriptional regulator [Clostridium merdae]
MGGGQVQRKERFRMDSNLAVSIRRIIRQQGYKQSAIAERAGINEKTFSNMLNGRKIIASEDIYKILAALGVTPNELFGFDDQPQKSA